jgi:hypothetical protein
MLAPRLVEVAGLEIDKDACVYEQAFTHADSDVKSKAPPTTVELQVVGSTIVH